MFDKTSKIKVSIIIPTLNEVKNIKILIPYLFKHGGTALTEIIVVDAFKSKDGTAEVAAQLGATVIKSKQCCRAVQLNEGAAYARSALLYFVHADVLPPTTYLSDLQHAIEAGKQWGFFSYRFKKPHTLLKINAYYTRFDGLFAGGGDQTLFILKSAFDELGGFDESYRIMEDFEFTKRAKAARLPFKIIKNDVKVSARKYTSNSYLRVNLVNLWMFILFWQGAPQEKMIRIYQRWLK